MVQKQSIILGIETSCDDTAIAILRGNKILSNYVATQEIHTEFGGVVPELASRAHQQNIIPVLEKGLKEANCSLSDIDAIAYSRGPGLLGSLLVGSSFAKGLSLGLNKPLLEVNHMKAHISAHFINDNASTPKFPFLCLTVSGGHTQIVLVKSFLEMEVLGNTLDDAAGEAFDKAAKMMEIPYPGGPLIDKYAKTGNHLAFPFKISSMKGYNFSFSGLKTGILYFLRQKVEENPHFIQENLNDICASVQHTIITILLKKLSKVVKDYNIHEVAIAGGVSANSELRKQLKANEVDGWKVHLPKFEYCTDNGAMIAIAGKFLFEAGQFGDLKNPPSPRLKF
ncbi:tRNA (adenosine(37)-N6)-threonylcarbamoyltransferase complex transferase subunit TsaD [Vicingaceae bacterium]|nr:tRNA (adenosine(37)-N6)-threonylcarbamoyltransferase complex transferase subunit TsaD [Vicingaceae bacterium]MDC1451218.1 tRNA (adenosine(37)-N6)-threonylcarbamoyltransferase complex transferase subunit TsaD [Vicingaceae bacterium]